MAKFTWRELNQTLGTKTEAEVLAMLNEERSGRNRKVVLERLHQRYSILRVSRERLEIMTNEKVVNWIAKGVPLESEEQTDTIGKVGFIPSFIPITVGGIVDEIQHSPIDTLEKQIAFIDEQQVTIETLKAINEELKSTNEELRSAKSGQRWQLKIPLVPYILQVRKEVIGEGIVAHSSVDSLRELLIKNEAVIQQLNSHDFIKSLVHLVIPDRVGLLERAGGPTHISLLLHMIRNREGPFEQGVVGSPFHAICDRLRGSAPGGGPVRRGALVQALKEAGWQDMGRLGAVGLGTKKHIFAAPDMAHLSKSELRRAVEDAN